jgi:hypothetical protein
MQANALAAILPALPALAVGHQPATVVEWIQILTLLII